MLLVFFSFFFCKFQSNILFYKIIDLDEQFLKQQAVVEELNSNLTSFIVANNIDIQSHDENLDSSFTEQTPVTPPGMPPSDLKDLNLRELVEPTGSPQLEYNDTVSDICIINTAVDQSKQATPSSSIDLDNTNSKVKKKNSST